MKTLTFIIFALVSNASLASQNFRFVKETVTHRNEGKTCEVSRVEDQVQVSVTRKVNPFRMETNGNLVLIETKLLDASGLGVLNRIANELSLQAKGHEFLLECEYCNQYYFEFGEGPSIKRKVYSSTNAPMSFKEVLDVTCD